MSATPALTAGQLRKLADALDSADGMPVYVHVGIGPSYGVDQGARVATVNTLAALVGLAAEPAMSGSLWYHEARDDRDGVRLSIRTGIDAPAQRCACGAVCSHAAQGERP